MKYIILIKKKELRSYRGPETIKCIERIWKQNLKFDCSKYGGVQSFFTKIHLATRKKYVSIQYRIRILV